jgi:hypothetical protein
LACLSSDSFCRSPLSLIVSIRQLTKLTSAYVSIRPRHNIEHKKHNIELNQPISSIDHIFPQSSQCKCRVVETVKGSGVTESAQLAAKQLRFWLSTDCKHTTQTAKKWYKTTSALLLSLRVGRMRYQGSLARRLLQTRCGRMRRWGGSRRSV